MQIAIFCIFFISIAGAYASDVNYENTTTNDLSQINDKNSVNLNNIATENSEDINTKISTENKNSYLDNSNSKSENNLNQNTEVSNYKNLNEDNNLEVSNYNSPNSNDIIISSSGDLDLKYGNNNSYKVNLTDKNGNPIVGEKINITLTNPLNQSKTYFKYTDENGIATLGINLIPETYTLSYKYGSQSGSDTIKISYGQVSLNGSDLIQIEGENKYFEIILTDAYDNPIANQQISFKLINSFGGSKTYYLTTDSTGKAQIKIGLIAGIYTAEYSYESAKKTNNIIIKMPTIISADDLSQTEGDGEYFEISLTDKNGNPLSNEIVSVTLTNVLGQSKTYKIATDSNGVAKLQINLIAGTYGISYKYESDYYGVSTGSNSINIEEKNTLPTVTITAKPSAGGTGLSYKWYTTTWINYCPLCKHYNTLTINPKGVPERELTCSYCDADYCGASGKEKSYVCKGYLTKA